MREFTIDAADRDHWEKILRAIGSTRGARVLDYVDRTMQMHRGGKIDIRNKYPVKTRDDLSMAYTPGVARVCMDIHADRAKPSSTRSRRTRSRSSPTAAPCSVSATSAPRRRCR